jgi:competence protein ComEA
MERIVLFVKEFWIVIMIGIVGVGILIWGLWGVMGEGEAKVEIVSGNQSSKHSLAQGSELGSIVVDVAGVVQNPGVYKLQSGSRIGDALFMAGGLAESADREWVVQTLNLASELKDGQKIYIPWKQEIKPLNQNTITPLKTTGKVNINTASATELDALVGIGEARAAAIIAGRPYASTEELISKVKIAQSVYDKIKDQVSVLNDTSSALSRAPYCGG